MTDEVKQLHKGFLEIETKRLADHARRLSGERVEEGVNMAAGMNQSLVINGHRHMMHREVLNYIRLLEKKERAAVQALAESIAEPSEPDEEVKEKPAVGLPDIRENQEDA